MPGAVGNPLAEVPACAVAAPTFPRPRGRAPPGCTWDVQRGGWWRADGSAWKQVRNEKRLQAREARRVEKAPEKAAEQAHRERFAAYWAEDRARCKDQRESLKRDKEERLTAKERGAASARGGDGSEESARAGGAFRRRDRLLRQAPLPAQHRRCARRDVRRLRRSGLARCQARSTPCSGDLPHTSPKLIRTLALTGASSSRMGASSARPTSTAVAQQALSVGPRTRPTLSRARCSIVKIRDDFEKTFGFLNTMCKVGFYIYTVFWPPHVRETITQNRGKPAQL